MLRTFQMTLVFSMIVLQYEISLIKVRFILDGGGGGVGARGTSISNHFSYVIFKLK